MDYSKSVVEERSRTEEETHLGQSWEPWHRTGTGSQSSEKQKMNKPSGHWTRAGCDKHHETVTPLVSELWTGREKWGWTGFFFFFLRLFTFMSVRCPELSHLQPTGIGWSVRGVGGQRGGAWVTWQEGTGACRQGVACGRERRTSVFKKTNTDWFLFCTRSRFKVCVSVWGELSQYTLMFLHWGSLL